ncbi:MAG: biopolymer transporter ExbD [Bacteroidota bacterium]
MLPKKRERLSNSINAGSMADIAFLLLIFFLVSTNILSDKGITVKLPPWEIVPPSPLPDKNVLTVKVNARNEILLEGEEATVGQLKGRAKEFIMNPRKLSSLPTRPKNAIISLQNDRGTRYETYIHVYNELKAAYNELWDQESRARFGKGFDELTKVEKKAILKDIPLVISEADPTDYNSDNI